jgi:hypothetical protein
MNNWDFGIIAFLIVFCGGIAFLLIYISLGFINQMIDARERAKAEERFDKERIDYIKDMGVEDTDAEGNRFYK